MSQTHSAQRIVAQFEAPISAFKPSGGLAAINPNDLRYFVYEWFTQFEHAAPATYYVDHLAEADLEIAFPGSPALTTHADFVGWYNNLLAQTVWNFHDLGKIEIQRSGPQKYLISFIVDWYGEVRADSEQLAGWQMRADSNLYHHTLRQTWTMKTGDHPLIEKLVVTGGDTPSPIRG